jgi:prepilin signal peptidase PulO-like enzyme (type II secretory pathway)
MNELFLFFIFIIGTAIGSFLNVLIDRLPNEEKITGRSKCDYCHHQLAWYDLIPIVSYFLLKGRCRYCHKKISWQYPMVEFLTGVFFVLISLNLYPVSKPFYQIPYPWVFYLVLANFGLISCLIVIFFSDAKYHIIPDQIQLFFFIFSLILIPFYNQLLTLIFPHKIIAGLVIMVPIFFIHYLTGGKAMGFGDVKLAFNIGFLLGLKAGFLALYLAFILGGIVGFLLIIFGRKKLKSKIAFGPFLVFGIIIMIFWGEKILSWVSRVYGF